MYQRGRPMACQRIPPNYQTDLAKPHEQRTIHERECASIDSTQRRGKIVAKNLWTELIAANSFLLCDRCDACPCSRLLGPSQLYPAVGSARQYNSRGALPQYLKSAGHSQP